MTENSYNKLFEIFPEVSFQEWEKAVNEDLKGADYEKKLVWNSPDGFKIKPYYRAEDLDNKNTVSFQSLLGNKLNNQWLICQNILVDNFKEANNQANEAVKRGADAINFVIKKTVTKKDTLTLLAGFDFNTTTLYFTSPGNELLIYDTIAESGKNIKGAVNFDPMGYLSVTGNYPGGSENFAENLKKFYTNIKCSVSGFKLINVGANNFHNCGSSASQELGLSLSLAVEYLHRFTDSDLIAEEIFKTIKFTFSIGNNYFFEIAKLRAARYLWAKIAESYKIQDADVAKMYIHSETSLWNMSKYDPHVNMLRATTEAMSAIIGGSDSVSINPFDVTFKKQNEFSSRVARSTQIVLKSESNLDKVADAAAGSYYIESLTNSFIEEAWKIFMQIEDFGGYLKALEKGLIQKMLSETSAKRDLEIALKNEKILGTNLYPNINEEIANIDEKPDLFENPVKDFIAVPLKQYRGAKAFEELRLKTETSGRTPKVFLLTLGNPAMRKARAAFSAGFFSCSGFKIIDNAGFKTIDEGISAAKKSKAEITVICSSDDEYPEFIPQIVEKLKDSTILVLAGYPKNHVEEFQKLGLKNFIHTKSNILETLKDLQKQLGIESRI